MANLSRPALQGFASKLEGDDKEALQAQSRAQDKYNLDLFNALSPVLAPIVWTPLTPINNWLARGSGLTPPGWYQDYTGRVWLRGALEDGDLDVPMFSNLVPKPQYTHEFCAIGGSGAGSILVLQDGTVKAFTNFTAPTEVSLDGINYLP